MFEIIKESLLDEDLKGSSARLQSFFLVCVGAFIAITALFLVAFGCDVSSYATGIVGIAWGASSAKTWAGQIKSAKIKVSHNLKKKEKTS